MSTPTFAQAMQVLNLIKAKEPSLERLEALFSSGILSDLLDPAACLDRNVVRAALRLDAVALEPLILEINYSDSLEALIAAGHYDWTNSDITSKRFPIKGTGIQRFDVKVFHFGRNISSEEAVATMKAEGFGAAQIEHVLTFGAKYPDVQREYPIIGLGSVAKVGVRRHVPYLGRDGGGRSLFLHWWIGGWTGSGRFLGVRLVSNLGSSAA